MINEMCETYYINEKESYLKVKAIPLIIFLI